MTESQPILMPDGSPMPFPPPSRASMHFGSGGNYGAMGLPPTLGISRASSFRSLPLSRPPSRMRQASFSPRVQAYGENIVSPPQPLRVPNPFWDPATRVRTPDSAYVAATYGAPAAGEKLSGYFSPSQDTPLYTSIRSPPMAPVPSTPPSPSSSISLYADEDEDRTFGSTSPILTSSLAYLSPYDPRVKSTISPSPPRTNTPSSLHSVAPSVHFANPMSRPPLPASPRAMNGPLSRSYTASPRLSHSPEAHLPTPFPPVARAATLHRYASINNAIGTGQNTSIGSPRNALYHQGMMGQDMDITSSPAYRNSPYSAGIGSGMNNTQWRQLVMNAANSR